MADFYRKGWSLRDIARECGCSKNKIRNDLQKAGIELRERSAQSTPCRADSGKQSALPYFGFCYFDGRIVPDPREFPILKLIHRLWKDRKTIHQITQDLNRSKTPSRKGKEWSWAAVQNIVKRFEQGIVTLHGRSGYKFK